MGTHYQGTATEKLALEVYIKLSRATEMVETRINCRLKDYHLTLSQFGVLEALYHLGPLHQYELAGKVLKSSGNLTLVIDNLVKQGLVERGRDAADRRCLTIGLTEAGRQLISDMFPSHVGYVVEAMGVLTPEEQQHLAALCRKLGLAQKKSNGGLQ